MHTDLDPNRGRRRFAIAAAIALTAAALLAILLVLNSPEQLTRASEPPDGPRRPVPASTQVPPTSVQLDEPMSPPMSLRSGPLPESGPLSVEIPSIGVATGRLVDLGLAGDRALEVPDDAHTAGWFELSPTPGEVGPSVIAGHVNYASEQGVFARLGEVRTGERIIVHRADGAGAVFTAYRVDRYAKSAFPTGKVYGDTEFPELRLITCGGAFDRSSGQYRDNVIVFARLTATS